MSNVLQLSDKIWITADLHFGHQKDFLWKPRGFSSSEEHDNVIVSNWNNVVKPNDTVYILGDLMLGNQDHGIEYLNKLNGFKRIILGNHDTITKITRYSTEIEHLLAIGYGAPLEYKKYRFFLSHYPTLTANYTNEKHIHNQVINLCGHSHVKDPFADWNKGIIYHCELDAHNNYPVALDKIIEDIKNKVENYEKEC